MALLPEELRNVEQPRRISLSMAIDEPATSAPQLVGMAACQVDLIQQMNDFPSMQQMPEIHEMQPMQTAMDPYMDPNVQATPYFTGHDSGAEWSQLPPQILS